VSGWFGLVGTFLPLFVAGLCALGPLRGRKLWSLSLVVHLVSWVCFLGLAAGFYTHLVAQDAAITSPVILTKSAWSGNMGMRWTYQSAILSLAAASVVVCFHLIGREILESSRATLAGLSAYLTCVLGALGADHPLLFCVFLAGAILPRLVFTGLDSGEDRIQAVKETAFLSVVAFLSLLLCVLVFAEPFRASLPAWFTISGATMEALPGSIGFSLMLLAAFVSAGIFPFHGSFRRVYEMASMQRAVPLALQPLFGFSLLFGFGPSTFPNEFHLFGPTLLGIFSVGVAYCAVGFLGSRQARDRIFWLQQVMSCLIAIGFFSLTLKGWHGASVLLFFQSAVVPFCLLVLACHERRPGFLPIQEIGKFPAFALSTVLAVLFSLFLPVTVGFYGVLLVIWSLVKGNSWPLPFVILAVPMVAIAGLRIMFFRLGEENRSAATGTFTDLQRDELFAIFPLGFTLLLLGLVPKILLGPMGVSVGAALRVLGIKE
jgi:NADH-quinone oxidoreductase subunit M